jgi:site-specific recombinase XerC
MQLNFFNLNHEGEVMLASAIAIAGEPLLDQSKLISSCLKSEEARHLSTRSLYELRLHLNSLSEYCNKNCLHSISEITPAFLKDFVLEHASRGAALVKMIVWTLRKFGAYLALLQLLPDNPAKDLEHPKHNRREKLPQYLKPEELRNFLSIAT